MAILFTVEDGVARPYPETLLIEPFKSIWERDESKSKAFALEDFTYIEFMCSKLKTNPFRGYKEDARHLAILEKVVTRENWFADGKIRQGIEWMKEFQTEASPDYGMLIDSEFAAQKLRDYFRNFDITERNDKGMPVYKPKEITSALIDVDKVITNLDALRKKVEEAVFEETKTKAQKEISPFANPDSL